MPVIRTRLTLAAAAGALALGGLAPALPAGAAAPAVPAVASAAPAPAAAKIPLIKVTLVGTDAATRKVVVDGSLVQRPGLVRILLTVPRGRPSGFLKLMALRAGYTEEQYLADNAALEEAAFMPKTQLALMRKIQANVVMVAGVAAVRGHPVTMTVKLGPGTYHLGKDEREDPLPKHKLVVSGTARPGDLPAARALVAADGPTIKGANTLPAGGVLRFRNTAGDGWHQFVIQRVGDGTTRKQVRNYFHDPFSDDVPDFFKESLVVGVLSRGRAIVVKHDLPAGTYMVADLFGVNPKTGRPYALRGMYKVVKLT